MTSYDSIRSALNTSTATSESRVEVNQRALIDKILARYASAGAVYRELLQNSNDAEATKAQLNFTTEEASNIVTQVEYKNNGMPFRPQDWSRLKKIAEGNPDESKVGAFGVGAYAMFSICEEPMVVSGEEALVFVWKGDSLWCKVLKQPRKDTTWTSFLLPSRDPYPLPDLIEFGQFLCSALTFTQCLQTITVSLNGKEMLSIVKENIQKPTIVEPPKSTSWWKNDGAMTSVGCFALQDKTIYSSRQKITVKYRSKSSSIVAAYIHGTARTKIPPDMVRRMERVTKKKPPSKVTVQLLVGADDGSSGAGTDSNEASRVTGSFLPQMGQGRIFIGFRTSQTTGLGCHLAAPLIPTVEREAIDLQDPTLRKYNTELLEFAGILMRLTLEHGMVEIGHIYESKKHQRDAFEKKLLEEAKKKKEQSIEEPEPPQKPEELSAGASFLSFARFMAKGVTKQITNVIAAVTEDDTLLKPLDPLPLQPEERQAILLMRSFCPRPSTPDVGVGMALAQGFTNCMPSNTSPPVLTKHGVLRGDRARLPHLGMESFCKERVVRTVVFKNAEEYHQVLARCRPLTLDDLVAHLGSTVLTEAEIVRLVQWWCRFARAEPNLLGKGVLLKERARFLPNPTADSGVVQVIRLESFLYYVDEKKLPSSLPIPETCLPLKLQEAIGSRVLSDSTLRGWFLELPLDVYADFISHHRCMTAGIPEDDKIRMEVLKALYKEYMRRSMHERVLYGNFLGRLFREKRCLPFDSSQPTQFSAERPPDLYLNSDELKAFDNIGSFNKVSMSMKDAGISDEFLVFLGVRKSVAIDFLFANLDSLQWSDDPKPLIEYLRKATLTMSDVEKLKQTQYLPCENDVSKTFAPRELYLPNSDLRIFPFVKLLQWPSEDDLSERSANGKFLTKLGCSIHPPLLQTLKYISDKVDDDTMRERCLDYVVKQLGPGGAYQRSYASLRRASLEPLRFLPCVYVDVLTPASRKREMHSPLSCYSSSGAGVMSFPVLDPDVDKRTGHLYGPRFELNEEPDVQILLSQLLVLVQNAKAKLAKPGSEKLVDFLLKRFVTIFQYLSSRSNEFKSGSMGILKKEAFIPCKVGKSIEWFKVSDVYFKSSEEADSFTAELFQLVDFNPFLSAAGVRSEPNNHDFFRLMLADPSRLLKILGEEKYRTLLRRIASQPPFRSVTPAIRNSPFLLAYKLKESDDGGENRSYLLARAQDIFIIDNSFFGRMFSVIRAPHESDLENFYHRLGSAYISKKVVKSFDVIGRYRAGTQLAAQLSARLQERRPLLVSPSVTSRPLVKNASAAIDESNLQILEADDLKAVYSLESSVRNQRITCCSKAAGRRKNSLYLTSNFDWFDVGYAIGGLILERCQLEDAFFIGSLLEAPMEQLRARGFPVDRILAPPQPEPEPEPHPATKEPPKVEAKAAPAATSSRTSNGSGGPEPSAKDEKSPAGEGGIEEVLKQMFPDCDEDYIKSRLGKQPSMDKVQKLAEEMSSGNYPKKKSIPKQKAKEIEVTRKEPSNTAAEENKRRFGKRFGRALSGLRGPAPSGLAPNLPNPVDPISKGGKKGPMAGPGSGENDGKPVSPQSDSASQANMEQMLKNQVGNSATVNSRGVNSVDSVMTAIPESLNRPGEGCEVIPGQALKPFSGQYRNFKSHNGIRVFSARLHPSSEHFLTENFHAVDTFADVLENLCGVYDLKLSSVAIFHDPTGGTIAFNANRALHFNVRFFFALHYSKQLSHSRDAYSYWFTIMAHELAHHLVSAHNKEHGYYTESYVSLYLPQLITFFSRLEKQESGTSAPRVSSNQVTK